MKVLFLIFLRCKLILMLSLRLKFKAKFQIKGFIIIIISTVYIQGLGKRFNENFMF
jgi:hypothetical protein